MTVGQCIITEGQLGCRLPAVGFMIFLCFATVSPKPATAPFTIISSLQRVLDGRHLSLKAEILLLLEDSLWIVSAGVFPMICLRSLNIAVLDRERCLDSGAVQHFRGRHSIERWIFVCENRDSTGVMRTCCKSE